MGFRVKGLCLLLVCLVFVLPCFWVAAVPIVSLSLYKDNGYGMGNDMNGAWTVNAAVSQNTSYVEFYLDDTLQLNDTSAPFSWQFDTINYTEGTHTIKAVAYDSAGENATAQVDRNFVGFPVNFVVGIIAVVVAVTAIAVVVSVYRIRKQNAKKT